MSANLQPPIAMAAPIPLPLREPEGQGVRRAGLWVLMGVIAMLFFLFSCAYVMRMGVADWRPLPFVPWQLWCSSALLTAAGMAWQLAWRASVLGRRHAAQAAAALAWTASALFVGAQLWAWQAMQAQHFFVAANPANSFFYLITGLHGLHVLGGMAAATVTGARLLRGGSLARARGALELCARYWHFLLALWVAMFALLFLVTPDTVQLVCSSLNLR